MLFITKIISFKGKHLKWTQFKLHSSYQKQHTPQSFVWNHCAFIALAFHKTKQTNFIGSSYFTKLSINFSRETHVWMFLPVRRKTEYTELFRTRIFWKFEVWIFILKGWSWILAVVWHAVTSGAVGRLMGDWLISYPYGKISLHWYRTEQLNQNNYFSVLSFNRTFHDLVA